MSREEIKEALYQAIENVEELNGDEKMELNEKMILRNDIIKFDSLCEINVVTELEEILEVDLDERNIFMDKENQSRNLEQVVDYLQDKFENRRKKNGRKTN